MAKRERITIDGYEIWGLNVLETIGIEEKLIKGEKENGH